MRTFRESSDPVPENPVVFRWEEPWLSILADALDLTFDDPRLVESVARSVRNLHAIFIGRSSISPGSSPYGEDHAFRRGYGIYYLMVNVPKIIYIMEHICPEIRHVPAMLDWGTGPGTVLLSTMIARIRNQCRSSIQLSGIDRSPEFIKLANHMIKSFREHADVPVKIHLNVWDVAQTRYHPSERFPLVTVSNMMNEIPSNRLEQVIDNALACVADQGYLLLMEPALMQTGRNLLVIRERLIGQNVRVIAPCPGQYACPALTSASDWCHHRLRWQPPAFIERVDQLTGLNKQTLNFSFFILQKGPLLEQDSEQQFRASGWYRVVSDLLPSKGKVEVFLCAHDIANPQTLGMKYRAVLKKRDLSGSNKDFLTLHRYDRLTVENGVADREILNITEHTKIIRLTHRSMVE